METQLPPGAQPNFKVYKLCQYGPAKHTKTVQSLQKIFQQTYQNLLQNMIKTYKIPEKDRRYLELQYSLEKDNEEGWLLIDDENWDVALQDLAGNS